MRFSILGPLEVFDDGQPLQLGAGRQRKLLAILLLHANEAVSTDRLIDELWDEHPPETAAKALQGLVSQLRKRLGPDSLLTVPSGYVLKLDGSQLDSQLFEQLLADAGRAAPDVAAYTLREALMLWRGPPLADFAYDEFARNEIDRLEELRLATVEKLIDAELALGRHDDAIPELESLVAEHPLRERFCGHLMLALYRAGRQADALQVYQRARERLREELGLEPADELKALQKAILGHDPSLAPPRRVRPAPPRRRPRPRILLVVGGLLIVGAIAAVVVLLTAGSSPAVAVTANSVAVLDGNGRHVVADIPVGNRPLAVAVGFGSAWVANADDGTVMRVDTKTHKVVAAIGVGADVSNIAIGFGSVWVADGNDGKVTRIDPRLNAVETTLDFGPRPQLIPTAVFLIAVDSTHVWATRGGDLLRIDPKTDQVDRHIGVGAPVGLATGGGFVWITTLSEHLLRIDANTGALTVATLPTQGTAPVFAHGSVWLIANLGHGEIERLDPNSLTATATAAAGNSPTGLAADRNAIWASLADGTIARIDASSANVTTAVAHVGQFPTSLTIADGLMWITVAAPGTT